MDTTEMEKLRILTMWECGKTTAEIAKSINKSTRTVQRWLSLQKKDGNMQKKERGRRPRKTTPEEDAKIVQFVKENPDLTQKEILTICNINIYKGTLRRRLQEAKTGGLDLDLFKGSKAGKGKRTKKGSKKSSTDILEASVPHETVQMAIDAINNSSVDAKCLSFEHQQNNSSVDTNSLHFDHQQQYSNDGTHYEHEGVSYEDHGPVPAGEDGLYVITETIQESQSDDADHVFNELITDATRMVKIEMVEPIPTTSTPTPVVAATSVTTSECEESTVEEEETSVEKPKRKRIRRPQSVTVKSENVAVEVTDANKADHLDQEIITIEIKQEKKAARKRRVKSELDDTGAESTSTESETKKARRARKSDERRNKIGRRRRIKDEHNEKKSKTKKEKINWMKDGKDTTDMEKSKILIMTECGMSTSEIAKSLKKSRRTVQRWLSKHNKGIAMERKERGRRPRKTTSDEDARIVQFVKENPHLSRKEVLQYGNIHLHKVTLKNRLNEAGIFFNSQGVKILDFTNNEEAAQSQNLNPADNYNLLY